jgi:hypothetical protein
MADLRQAAQQALKVLESHATHGPLPGRCPVREAEYALRAALAQPSDSELPDDIRVPLHRIWADIGYLIGRAKLGGDTDLAVHTVKALCDEVERAVRAALAQQEQEPVAWTDRELELIDGMIEVQLRHAAQCDGIANRTMAEKQKSWDMERVALLHKIKSSPPRCEWQGLTEEEILLTSVECAASHQQDDVAFARAIEAKLKEKNNG